MGRARVLFSRPGGDRLDAALIGRIRSTIRAEASPRHVPANIIRCPTSRAHRGKIVEGVREVFHGRPVKNRDALANPGPGALRDLRRSPKIERYRTFNL